MIVVGVVFYPIFNFFNKLTISGTENIAHLPKGGVLFVSNHQTYYTDVICMYQIFNSIVCGLRNNITNPKYFFRPFANVYYIAAAETMQMGIIPRIFAYTGSVSIKRTWREGEQNVQRELDWEGIKNIATAVKDGWVVTFPQGTTKPFAPGRMGSAHLIKQLKPIVVPVTIDGFGESFGKTGLNLFKKPGTKLKVNFKKPLDINYNKPVEDILDQVMNSIEQSEEFQKSAVVCGSEPENEHVPIMN